jgi:hypothetical protein
MGPLAIIGSFVGGWVAAIADPRLLKLIFGVVMLISSGLIVLRGSTKPSAEHEFHNGLLSRWFLPVLGFFVGMVGSFLGIGGGAIMIPSLVLLFSIAVTRVAGTSSATIIFIGLSGCISYMVNGWNTETTLPGWQTGYVWWTAAIPLALAGVPAAQFGAWLNQKIHALILKRIFGLVLLVLALRILITQLHVW